MKRNIWLLAISVVWVISWNGVLLFAIFAA
jgi:hypothetical protein